MKLLLKLATVVFFVPLFIFADGKSNHRIQLDVSAPETIKGEVTSYLSREIRRIGDVELVDTDPFLKISVLALVNSSRANGPIGYTLVFLVEKPVRYRQFRSSLAKSLDPTTLAVADFAFDNTTSVLSHFVQVGGVEDLEMLCKKSVAEIDGTAIEGQRKLFQQMVDAINNSKNSANK